VSFCAAADSDRAPTPSLPLRQGEGDNLQGTTFPSYTLPLTQGEGWGGGTPGALYYITAKLRHLERIRIQMRRELRAEAVEHRALERGCRDELVL